MTRRHGEPIIISHERKKNSTGGFFLAAGAFSSCAQVDFSSSCLLSVLKIKVALKPVSGTCGTARNFNGIEARTDLCPFFIFTFIYRTSVRTLWLDPIKHILCLQTYKHGRRVPEPAARGGAACRHCGSTQVNFLQSWDFIRLVSSQQHIRSLKHLFTWKLIETKLKEFNNTNILLSLLLLWLRNVLDFVCICMTTCDVITFS